MSKCNIELRPPMDAGMLRKRSCSTMLTPMGNRICRSHPKRERLSTLNRTTDITEARTPWKGCAHVLPMLLVLSTKIAAPVGHRATRPGAGPSAAMIGVGHRATNTAQRARIEPGSCQGMSEIRLICLLAEELLASLWLLHPPKGIPDQGSAAPQCAAEVRVPE